MKKFKQIVSEISESKASEEKALIKQAIGNKKISKDVTTSVVKGDFVVSDRGTVIGRLKKGEWKVPSWMSE